MYKRQVLRVPLARQARPIIDAVKSVLEESPPELVADVMKNGIVIAGGGRHDSRA